MQQTILQFPELQLRTRDGHKLRGYFARTFGQDSDLFHNHSARGKVVYRYPLIQYKVVHQIPMMMGLGEGADLIADRFLGIKAIQIDEHHFPLSQKHLSNTEFVISQENDLYAYEFVNSWLPLNQQNHRLYQLKNERERKEQLRSILINNLLSFLKAVDFRAEHNIMVHLDLNPPKFTKFKNQPMLSFKGAFVCNLFLPSYIGLGKSVSRGFGTIIRKS